VSAIATGLRLLSKKASTGRTADPQVLSDSAAPSGLSKPSDPDPTRQRSAQWSRATLLSGCASLLVHVVALTVCSLVWLALPSSDSGHAEIDSLLVTEDTNASNRLSDELDVEEVDVLTPETPPLNLGAASLRQRDSPVINPARAEAIAVSRSSVSLTAAAATSPWTKADLLSETGGGRGVSDLIGAGAGSGEGMGDGSGNSFFGLRPVGRKVAYVLDCSRSMNHPHNTAAKTRFKRMKLELVKSVRGLAPESEFYFVFFNDLPVPMPARSLVPATDQPKLKYLQWMQRVKADGNTEPTQALQIALRHQPDTLYFLTDGNFTHRVQQELLRLRSGKTDIHTFAFDAPLTDSMRKAYQLLLDDDLLGAR